MSGRVGWAEREAPGSLKQPRGHILARTVPLSQGQAFWFWVLLSQRMRILGMSCHQVWRTSFGWGITRFSKPVTQTLTNFDPTGVFPSDSVCFSRLLSPTHGIFEAPVGTAWMKHLAGTYLSTSRAAQGYSVLPDASHVPSSLWEGSLL